MTALNEKDEHETINETSAVVSHIISTNDSLDTPSPTTLNQGTTVTKKGVRVKRRKTETIISLHNHLQGIIIPTFTSVNEPDTDARDEHNEKVPGNC
jgi:hypothetical protein